MCMHGKISNRKRNLEFIILFDFQFVFELDT